MKPEHRATHDDPWVEEHYLEQSYDLADSEIQGVIMDEVSREVTARVDVNNFIFAYHDGYRVHFTGSLRRRIDELKEKWSEFYNDRAWDFQVARAAWTVGLSQTWDIEELPHDERMKVWQ